MGHMSLHNAQLPAIRPVKGLEEDSALWSVLARGVEEVIDEDHLRKRLESGERLRVKLGIDPTSPHLHLGRTVPLLKLRDFQQAGCQIVFIIGDFTGQIGDTSDKDSERPMLSEEEVERNLQTYRDQVGKILSLGEIEFERNSKWLSRLSYKDIAWQAGFFSVNDFVARENIARRLAAGKRVTLRETLYPLMQGYDSVAVRADVEIGGTDQRFNLLTGRDMQRLYSQEPQDILTTPIIEGTDGRKMSSSWGNTINILDGPRDMFGKLMTVRDELIVKYFVLLTREPIAEVRGRAKALERGDNPREHKLALAFAITAFYHSPQAAQDAQEYFIHTFSEKTVPSDAPELRPSAYDITSVLLEAGFVASKSEARRVLADGGVRVNGKVVRDPGAVVPPGALVQKGKRHFVRVL
ncbi:tyrosine--tRNA ligase [Candidatus Parcubacteria bacterium]|jgi:tyrosyl-tRNA synthetase|nr:MAG: tyrosine--tRNA ligase [Candidatus Parcubacteria bacterium]